MTTLADHLESLALAWADLWRPPPPPKPLLEFAASVRFVEGPRRGEVFDPREHGAQYEFLAAFAGAKHRTYVLVMPPQDGKTFVVFIAAVLWPLAELRWPVVFAAPDRELCGRAWRDKFRPIIRDQFPQLLPQEGPGSEGGTKPDAVILANGSPLYFIGAGASNEAAQAMVSGRIVWRDESDSIEPRRAVLTDRRREAFADGVSIDTSTVKPVFGGRSQILAKWRRGSSGRLGHPCPLCGCHQVWEWAAVRFDGQDDPTVRASAGIVCAGCEARLTPAEHRASLARWVAVHAGQELRPTGEVIGPMPPNETWALRTTSLDSPLKDLGNLVVEYHHAKQQAAAGDDTALAQFHRDHLTEDWTGGDRALALDRMALALRSALATHARGQAPAPAEIQTCALAIDVQWRRLFYLALTLGPGDRVHILDYGQVAVCGEGEDATPAQRWAALDRVEQVALTGWPMPTGLHVHPNIAGIDTADGHTRPDILAWTSEHPGWMPLRGQDGDRRVRAAPDEALGGAILSLPGIVTVYRQTHTMPPRDELAIPTDRVRAALYRGLRRESHEPGAVLLPRGESAGGDLIRHLCGKRFVPTATGGAWIDTDRRHDYSDCAVYASALAHYARHLLTMATTAGGQDPAAIAAAIAAGARS